MHNRRINKNGVIGSSGDEDSEDVDNDHRKNKGSCLKAFFISSPLRIFLTASVAIAALIAVFVLDDSSKSSSGKTPRTRATPSSSSSSVSLKTLDNFDFSKYENCVIRKPTKQQQQQDRRDASGEWKTKPLWFPSYPNAIDDKVVKELVSKITGIPNGAKLYYSKSANAKRCKGNTETAACLLYHPMIEMKPNPNLRNKDAYDGNVVVYGIRNPALAMPAFTNGKRIKYHNLMGQMPVEEWRKARDTYFEESFAAYKKQLVEWLSMSNYRGRVKYLALEDLMDVGRGPKSVLRIAKILKDAGFPTTVLPDGDDNGEEAAAAACVWYQSIGGKDALQKYYNNSQYYDYSDYVPGYTKEQQSFLLEQVVAMMKEHNDDVDLIRILTDYRSYIQHDLVVDVPWVNKTTTKAA